MNRRLGIIIGSATLAIIVVSALVVVLVNHKSSTGAPKTSTSGTTASATSSSIPPTSTQSGGGTALAPKSGVLFGSSTGTTDQSQNGRMAAVSSLQSSLGVNLAIVHVYAALGTSINTPSNLQFIAEHKTLLISWAGGETIKMREGQLDQDIVTAAQQVAALKVPVLFE